MRRELIRLAAPMAVGLISHSLMTTVDTLFVGRLGTDELAAVGLAGMVSFALLAFGMGMTRAAKTLIAQCLGAGRNDGSAYAAAGLALALAFGILVSFVAQALAPFIGALADNARVGQLAAIYLQFRAMGFVFDLLWSGLRESAYGHGDSTTPMRVSILANSTNIVLDALFIFGLELGVAGAALASSISAFIGVVSLGYSERRRSFGFSRVRRRHLWAVFNLGFPMGLEFLINIGSFLAMTIVLVRISPKDLAAHQIAIQLLHFVFLPISAVAEATTVIAGRRLGEKRLRGIFDVSFAATEISLGFAAVCIVVLQIFGGHIVSWFTDDASLAVRVEDLLWVSYSFLMADALAMIARGALRGIGDVRWQAIVGVIAAWVFTPTFAYLLGDLAGLGAVGAWIGLSAEIWVIGFAFWWRLISLNWRGAARKTLRLQRA